MYDVHHCLNKFSAIVIHVSVLEDILRGTTSEWVQQNIIPEHGKSVCTCKIKGIKSTIILHTK